MLQGSAYPVRQDDNYAQFRDILEGSNETYLPKQNMSNYQQWAEQQIMSCSFTHYFTQTEKIIFLRISRSSIILMDKLFINVNKCAMKLFLF